MDTQQDAMEKAKERLKRNYSKARSTRPGAQIIQPRSGGAWRPVSRAAPPRQITGEPPRLSRASVAQGWAVKQSQSTGGYYYVHTANGREWSQWEPPTAELERQRPRGAAPLARGAPSPERADEDALFDDDDDDIDSDSEDEMPVSELLARQATATDAAIAAALAESPVKAAALADSPVKRSRGRAGGVGGRRHSSKRRDHGQQEPVVPAAVEDDDASSVWSQSSLPDSNPQSPTYESFIESGGIDYESGFLDDENPASAGGGRGAVNGPGRAPPRRAARVFAGRGTLPSGHRALRRAARGQPRRARGAARRRPGRRDREGGVEEVEGEFSQAAPGALPRGARRRRRQRRAAARSRR